MLEVYVFEPANSEFHWHEYAKDQHYPVQAFENAKIFDGKSFWEAESEMEWVDD